MNKKEKSEHDELIALLKQQHADHTEMVNQMQGLITAFNRFTKELKQLRTGE